MLTKATRVRLTVFSILSCLVLAVSAISYVHLPQMFGLQRYSLSADFADTSGLYPGANVTLRGVDIGKVTGIDLVPTGNLVRISINDGVRIPVNSTATITSTSAIGEQYLDLTPRTANGPYLKPGAVIARAETIQMPPTSALLDSATQLLASVPKDRLRSVLGDLTTAFGDSGGDMQRLVEQSSTLLATAQQQLTPTLGLIKNSQTFLDTQQVLATQTTNYLEKLAQFTGTLATSDQDLRALLAKTAPAADETRQLVASISKRFPTLLDNIAAVQEIVDPYLPGVRQVLALLPPVLANSEQGAMVAAPGTTRIDFALNANNPPPCLKGYLPASQYQSPNSTKTVSTPAGLSCKLPPTSQVSVRGSRNYPCLLPNSIVSRAPSIEACLGKPPSLLPSTGFTRDSLPVIPVSGTSAVSSRAGSTASTPIWQTSTAPPTLLDLLVPVH
ncbi:MAG TPA: MlaD family protein [Marmoricola sp.]|nr:MlaD family protein [Marmoricola sp.]